MKNEGPTKTIRFSTRLTPCGCTVEVLWPSGRKRTKRFRNGYADAELSAKRWIDHQIKVIEEMVLIDGLSMPEILVNNVPQPTKPKE